MLRVLRNKVIKTLLLVLVGLLTVSLAACIFFGISGPRDLVAYYGMAREAHAIWKDLAWRRVRAGQSADRLMEKVPPTWTRRKGHYRMLTYLKHDYPGTIPMTQLVLVARDDRLIYAWSASCTWRHVFFDQMTPGECETLDWARLQ